MRMQTGLLLGYGRMRVTVPFFLIVSEVPVDVTVL